jgi:lysophospholipase L1-like esterase
MLIFKKKKWSTYSWVGPLITIFLGLSLVVIILEVLIRISQGELFSTSNLINRRIKKNVNTTQTVKFDPQLGWVHLENIGKVEKQLVRPIPQYLNRYFKITFNSQGFRETPNFTDIQLAGNKSVILALGDSFTFGGEVNDEETWPTLLQSIIKKRVLNGGVSRYGLDQMLIKAKSDTKKIRPRVVIFSLTPSNILRTVQTKKIGSFSYWLQDKPYFVKSAEGLKLIQPTEEGKKVEVLDPIRNVLGRSFLANFIFEKAFFDYWYGVPPWDQYPVQYTSSESPDEISCMILKEIKKLSITESFKPLILGQDYWQNPEGGVYTPNTNLEYAKKCAKDLSLSVVDLRPSLESLFNEGNHEYETLFFPGAHMTGQGNLFVARALEKKIKEMLQN